MILTDFVCVIILDGGQNIVAIDAYLEPSEKFFKLSFGDVES